MSHWITHELFAHVPECHGYVPLSIAFAQFVAVKCDDDPFDQEQLSVALRESSCAQEVLRWFLRMLQSGSLRSVSRPIGGGPTVNMTGSHWQADEVVQRFVTSQYSRASPFASDVESDSWVFIDEADFLRIWDEHKRDLLGEPSKRPRALRRPPGEEQTSASPADSALIGRRVVEDLVGLSRSTIYKMMQERRFPARIKVRNRSLWRRVEIEQWIETVGINPCEPSA